MARITIKSKHTGSVAAGDLLRIKNILGSSLQEAKERMALNAVILEHELFGNDFAALAARISELLAVLRQAGIPFTAYETGEGHLESNPDMEAWALTDEQLANLLEQASAYE